MSSITGISPNFQGTKKTSLGNDYEPTSKNKRRGAGLGLVAGGAYAWWELDKFRGKKHVSETLLDVDGNKLKYRETANRRNFIKQLNELNMTLNKFGKVGERGAIKNGFYALGTAIAISGAFVGAMIGKAIDSHNNHKLAQEADEKAQASK